MNWCVWTVWIEAIESQDKPKLARKEFESFLLPRPEPGSDVPYSVVKWEMNL